MKLLLDEHYAPDIAVQLRARGHDVVAVQEVPALRGLPDPELFAAAQRRERALVTENVADYLPLDAEYRARGVAHHGLVLTSNQAFPRGRASTLGALVTALDRLLSEGQHPPASSLVWWLQPAD